MENSRITGAMFRTFVFLGLVLHAVVSHTSALEPVTLVSADQPKGDTLGVAMEDLTQIDTVRNREVPVRIYAPALRHSNGPFPVVVLSWHAVQVESVSLVLCEFP